MKFTKKTPTPDVLDALNSLGDQYEDKPEVEAETPTAAPTAPATPTPNNQPVMMSFEQLKELLIEAKKPVISPAQLKQIADEQQTRKDNAAIIDQERAKKIYEQSICGHYRRDGSSRMVYVEHGNYLICQRCQDILRPDETNPNGSPNSATRRALFHEHFAKTNSMNDGIFS